MLYRNKIKGDKKTTYYDFKIVADEELKTLTITNGEYWQNNQLVFSDDEGCVIDLDSDKQFRVFLCEDGIEYCVADTLELLEVPTKPLVLLAYGTLEELYINEVVS